MSGWEHESADLFRAGKSGMAPTAADRERVRARLAAKLGAAAVGATITTTTAKASAGAGAGAAKGSAIALFAKIAAPIVLAGGAATLAAPHVMKAHPPPPAVVTAPLPVPPPRAVEPPPPPAVVTAPATVAVDDLPPAKGQVPATAPVRAAKKAAPPALTPEDAAEEARLVARIDGALRDGDAAAALRLADEHATRFPTGVLVEEREGGRAIARCMSGSRASGDAFLAAHARSPMRGRIVAACGTKEQP